jgi:hypothetical protein
LTEFEAPAEALPAFGTLFQLGVGVAIQTGTTLEDLLCCQWQIERAYVMNRISTLFLNRQSVDDLSAAIVEDGATLALSGAMPGLIGATMRRGGVLAPFRSGITHCAAAPQTASGQGRITLKLFNLLIEELGPRFLSQGVWIARSRLVPIFPGQPELTGDDDREICVYIPAPSPTFAAT